MKRIVKILLAGMCIVSVLGGLSMIGGVAAASDKVIYVSDSGKDTAAGTSSTAPKKTLASAYSALGKNGGTVVVCGTLTLSNTEGFVFPSCDGEIKITSSHNGESFNLAKLVLKNKTYISGDTVFENLSIESPSGNMIFCCGNNVTFGDGLKVRLSGSGSYPYIFGGTYAGKAGMSVDGCSFKDYTVTVNSGNWSCVRGGNYRDDGAQPMGFIGDVSVIINGGTFVGTGNSTTDLAVISATSFCGLEGDAYLEINGGSIASSIFGLGRPGSNSTRKLSSFEGDVTIKITGGRFTGTRLAAVQELMSQELEGNFTVDVTGGDFTAKFTKMQGDGVMGTSRAFVSTDAIHAKLTSFAKLIYVSEGGNDSATGGPESPLKTLAAAINAISGDKGGVIIIKDSASLDSFKRTEKLEGGVHIMGAEGAKLTLNGENTVNGEISIENIAITATGASLNSCGSSITAGKGITVEGGLVLNCGEGTDSRVLTVYSGTYDALMGGSASNGHTAVVMYGGTAKAVYGASGTRTEGDASVIILGGDIGSAIAAQRGCKGQAGVAVYGGTVMDVSSVETGRVSGNFGVALNTENATASINAKSVVGKKLWADNGVQIPEGFENAGRAVFVNEDGEGDGLSPLDASSRPYRALVDAKELGEGDYSLVVLGDIAVMGNVTLPDMGGKYGIGGYFCGVNWKNAFGSRIKLGAVITIGAEAVIENVEIVSYTNSAYIAANCNKLVIEKDVECGVNFARAITNYPSVCGGIATSAGGFGGNKPSDITVNGGTWHYVYGGSINLGSDEAAKRNVKGDISVVINGGEFLGGVAANGMNNLTGNATLTVNGGVFKCSIYGMPRANDKEGQKLRITGDVTVILNRGDFRGDILAVQRAEDINYEGTYTLTMGGGDYTRVSAVKGTDGLGAKAKCVLNVADNIDINAKLTGELTLENPIATFADPSVYYYEGWYYYTYSKDYAGKPGLWLTRATNIADLGKTEPMMVWSASQAGSTMKSLWAPQIYFLDGKWYIYATCSEEGTSEASRRFPFVWEGKGALPLDGFDLHGKIDNYDTSVHSYLSPRIIERGGVRYLVCGGFFRSEDKVAGQRHYQRLFIGELASPTKFKTGMTVIAQPTQTWEGTGKVQILEGPFPLYAPGGTLYIAYAAGETSGNEYCTGLLKFTGTEKDSLTDRSKWQKLEDTLQFMDYDNEVYSPGAMVFVKDPVGETVWGIFHAKFYPNVSYNHRVLYAMPVTFDGELPKMGAPEQPDVTYQMTVNPMPINDRIFGFTTVNTVTPSPDPFPETTANPADTDPADEIITGKDPAIGPKKNAILPIAIGAAAVAAAAAIVGVVVAKKKKK